MRWEFHSFGRQSPEAVLALHDAPDLTVGQGISWGYSKQTGKSSVLWSSNRLVSMSSMVWSKKRGDIRIYHADSKKKTVPSLNHKKKMKKLSTIEVGNKQYGFLSRGRVLMWDPKVIFNQL
jgi:hypothetical protein